MKPNIHVTYFKPINQGLTQNKDSICFAAEIKVSGKSGIILYDEQGSSIKYPFSEEGKRGSLYGIKLEGLGLSSYRYNFYSNDKVFTDPYAKEITGLEKWGDTQNGIRSTFGKLIEDLEWEDIPPLKTPYENSIFYGLNIRCFTMHKSSGVRNKGTFEGVVEKLPHLLSIGITAVELMPAYEYEECMFPTNPPLQESMKEVVSKAATSLAAADSRDTVRLNLWGFVSGFYFSPKASFAATASPSASFKQMVRELHKNRIEVIMQFYFPSEIRESFILDVLKYWVIEYHIDGFRLSGHSLPLKLIADEPILKDIKIRSNYFPYDEIYREEVPFFRNLSHDSECFRDDIRRYLKSDEGMISQFFYCQRCNPRNHGIINYLADYDGFSLYDCLTYERKHNEKNGENNQDGTTYNYSWNCGVEGESRKKAVSNLRRKQLKNAMSFLIFSQGTPYIFNGDEMANTRFGNNNAYCQDNETGWIKWKKTQFTEEILSYFRLLVSLRKQYQILHMKEELQVMDTKACGYPDISYHGAEAWRPDLNDTSRLAGIMLCGKYADIASSLETAEEASLYMAFNMHWESHELALPKLSKGMEWVKITDTSVDDMTKEISLAEKDTKIYVNARSISVYKSRFISKKAKHLASKAPNYEATAF